jgi:hypothetical protein
MALECKECGNELFVRLVFADVTDTLTRPGIFGYFMCSNAYCGAQYRLVKNPNEELVLEPIKDGTIIKFDQEKR